MRRFLLIAVPLLCIGLLAIFLGKSQTGKSGKHSDAPVATAGSAAPADAQAAKPGQSDKAQGVGPSESPKDAAQPSASSASTGGIPVAGVPLSKEEAAKTPAYYGTFPAVSAQANESTKSVVEALKDKKNPERLSPLIAPKPYNDAEFEKDKQQYCNTVEPGRAFQSSQPGPGVPRLQAVSEPLTTIVQGEKAALQVQTKPSKPVTLVAFDGGRFCENQLNTVTVVADEHGVATAHYEATSGVISEVNIQAASPVASGQVHFVVNVTKPKNGN